MKTLHRRCAGLDVHKKEVVACSAAGPAAPPQAPRRAAPRLPQRQVGAATAPVLERRLKTQPRFEPSTAQRISAQALPPVAMPSR